MKNNTPIILPKVVEYYDLEFQRLFLPKGEIISFELFKNEVASLGKSSVLSQEYCQKIFMLCYDRYDYIKFLWGYTHPAFVLLNQKIIERMVALVSRDDINELVTLNKLLPSGMSVIDKTTQPLAYEKYIANTWRVNEMPECA